MVCGDRVRLMFSNLLKDWEFCMVDYFGLSGDLLCAWNPNIISCSPFMSSVGVWMECLI